MWANLYVGMKIEFDGQEWMVTEVDFIFEKVTVRPVNEEPPRIDYYGVSKIVPFNELPFAK